MKDGGVSVEVFINHSHGLSKGKTNLLHVKSSHMKIVKKRFYRTLKTNEDNKNQQNKNSLYMMFQVKWFQGLVLTSKWEASEMLPGLL